MYVVGTAGHVDHGKSTLVRALTGIDPDRLREEKERGLTIDLGFAWLTLPSGREVSIVDVPGHERFIKNMLAGAGGVDLALIVIAADEGPMPQTREHLAILELLEIPRAVVALAKRDLVEPDYLDLVAAEIDDLLAKSRYAAAEVVPVSATTGEGLPALLAALDRALDATPPKRDLGRPRLPVDRAFTIQGFGTVVTGTLLDGSLNVGQEVELQPGRLRARIRGLQRHRTRVDSLEPGTRAAVNLSGIHADEVRRGMVVALPGAISPASALDVRISATTLLSHPLAHDAGLTVLCSTAESEARLRLLDADELLPGDSAWAQVVLESPIPALPGDHLVLRTANDTVAGGIIVAVNPRRHRRHHPPTLERLRRMLEGSPLSRILEYLQGGPAPGPELAVALGIVPSEVTSACADGIAAGLLIEHAGQFFSAAWLDSAASRVLAAVETCLADGVLRSSAPPEQVRAAAHLDAVAFAIIVQRLEREKRIEARGKGLVPAGFDLRLSPLQQAEADRYVSALAAGGASPQAEAVAAPLLAHLVERGFVVDAGGGVVFEAIVYATLVDQLTRHMEAQGGVSLAEARDLLGTSRKYAQALLEHLDARHVTRRVGDAHVLRAGAGAGR